MEERLKKDKNAWGKPSIIYNDLLDKLDFISFQEMVSTYPKLNSKSLETMALASLIQD